MKLLLEKHRFAPEMNKVFVLRPNGDTVLLATSSGAVGPGAFTSLSEFRKRRGKTVPRIMAWIESHYPHESQKWLERSESGWVTARSEALRFAREMKARLAPGGTVTVRTKLVYISQPSA